MNKRELRRCFEDGKLFAKDYVLRKIDQLDEPETLSQEWIDENQGEVLDEDEGIRFNAVSAGDLQNLLVPKHEEITEEQVAEYLRGRNMTAVDSELVYREKLDNKKVIEKPVIPQFVAEWFKENEEGLSDAFAYRYAKYPRTPIDERDAIDNWFANTSDVMETLVRMKNGYTVEEEKYYVVDKNGYLLLRRYENVGVSFMKTSTTLTVKKFKERVPEQLDSIQLTEKEIKDYDPRYLAFAIPTEEVAE